MEAQTVRWVKPGCLEEGTEDEALLKNRTGQVGQAEQENAGVKYVRLAEN